MGLFGKIKQGVTGKEYIDNFSCPRCGGRVYEKNIYIIAIHVECYLPKKVRKQAERIILNMIRLKQ